MSGARLALTGALNSSITAKMTRTSSAVPMIWSISGPHGDEKYGAGKVAKIEKVGDRVGRRRG